MCPGQVPSLLLFGSLLVIAGCSSERAGDGDLLAVLPEQPGVGRPAERAEVSATAPVETAEESARSFAVSVVTNDDKDRGAFKTPTIRNVAWSAPYMHDGSLKTLDEVVEWYDKSGHPNAHLSKDVKKLKLIDQEKKDLVEFMKACAGEFPEVETERLPQ